MVRVRLESSIRDCVCLGCRLSCVFGLIRCAWAAAGICHSQVRHFEGNFNLAGMEFFFACGGLGVVETTTVDVVRVCVMRVRVRQFLPKSGQKVWLGYNMCAPVTAGTSVTPE